MLLFSCLHIHVAVPISATWEDRIGIGSLTPCRVNPAVERNMTDWLIDKIPTPQKKHCHLIGEHSMPHHSTVLCTFNHFIMKMYVRKQTLISRTLKNVFVSNLKPLKTEQHLFSTLPSYSNILNACGLICMWYNLALHCHNIEYKCCITNLPHG